MTLKNLLENIKNEGVLKTPRIIQAFEKVDRADFVLDEHKRIVYADHPFPIGYGGTISQPTTVAFMLELLQPKKGDKILDVGSGSGWTTTLLAEIVGKSGQVFGVEIVPELVKFGQDNLKKYKLPQAQIIQAGKKLGLSKEAPFDKILVSAAGKELPQELIDQLKPGGTLVIPLKSSVWKITKTKKGKIKKEEFYGFSFVPLKT